MRTYSSDLFAREPLHLLVSHVASVGEKDKERVRGREGICEYLLAGGEYHGKDGVEASESCGLIDLGKPRGGFPRHHTRASASPVPCHPCESPRAADSMQQTLVGHKFPRLPIGGSEPQRS